MAGRVRRLVVAAIVLAAWMAVAQTGSVFTAVTTNPGNSFSATTWSSCPTVTPVWLTGFESGVAAGYNSIESRSGSYSMKVSKLNGGGDAVLSKTSLGGGTVVTMRVALGFFGTGSFPAADVGELVKIDITTGADAVVGFNFAQSKFTVKFAGGTAQSGPGGVIADQWYRFDLRVNVAANPHTIDWRADGVAMTQATIAQAADTFAGTIGLGSTVAADNFTAGYDDVLVTLASGSYPLPDGRILSLAPNSYVGKVDNATAYLKETNGTTDLSATSYQLLDESPTASSAVDYVQQTTGSATDYYAEFGFDDVTRTGCVNGVTAWAAVSAGGSVADTARTVVRTGGVDREVHNDNVATNFAVNFRSAVIASADGTWDATELSAATARIGYRRAGGSTPFWESLRLEYDQVPNAASAYANVVLADSPSSYWRLGESSSTNTAAASAGAITGTYSTGVTPSATSPTRGVGGAVGDTDSACYFDGSNDNVNFGDNYDFTGTASYSLEAWVRPNSGGTTTKDKSIISKTSSSTDQTGWAFGQANNTYTPEFSAWTRRANTNAVFTTANGTTALALFRWYHVVMTYDGSNMRLYVNGALEKTTATAVALTNTAFPLLVGATVLTSTWYLKAVIDEVAIYSTVLDITRIQAHYNAGRA